MSYTGHVCHCFPSQMHHSPTLSSVSQVVDYRFKNWAKYQTHVSASIIFLHHFRVWCEGGDMAVE
jgi:hypothetical protein